jgi:hypothetical protein
MFVVWFTFNSREGQFQFPSFEILSEVIMTTATVFRETVSLRSSETSATFYSTMWRHISEDKNFRIWVL